MSRGAILQATLLALAAAGSAVARAEGDLDLSDRLELKTDDGAYRLGQFQDPFSLEELTRSRYSTFMERGLSNAFAPGYHGGVSRGNQSHRWESHAAGGGPAVGLAGPCDARDGFTPCPDRPMPDRVALTAKL